MNANIIFFITKPCYVLQAKKSNLEKRYEGLKTFFDKIDSGSSIKDVIALGVAASRIV